MTHTNRSNTDSALKSQARTGFPDGQQWLALLVPVLICVYLIITSTVAILSELPVYDIKRIGQFILFPLAFMTALANTTLRDGFLAQAARIPRFVGLGVGLFFLLGIISSVVNATTSRGLIYSLIDVSMLGLLLILALVVAASRGVAGQQFDRIVIALLALLGLAVGVQEVTGFWAAWAAGYTYNFELALLHFSHPRMYNHVQTWTIPVLTALPFLFPRNRLAAIVCVIALGMNWYVLLVTGARGSIVGLTAAFTVAAVLSPFACKAIIKWQAAGILMAAVLYALMFAVTDWDEHRALAEQQQVPSNESQKSVNGATEKPTSTASNNRFFDSSVGRPLLHTTGRTRLWKSAINYATDHPMLGIGPMNFACKGPPGRVGSPHNLGFQILSEWGIPATVILGILGLAFLWHLLKSLRTFRESTTASPALHIFLMTAILAAMVDLMVSSLLIVPLSQMTAALVGGWLLAVSPKIHLGANSRPTIGVLPVALLISLLLLPFAYHETIRMPSYRDQLLGVEQGRPRLWQLGKACSDLVQ